MKRSAMLFGVFLVLLSFSPASLWAASRPKSFSGNGEVLSADPLYSRITIEGGAIKGFSQGGKNEFVVSSPELLKGLATHDLVAFDISETLC